MAEEKYKKNKFQQRTDEQAAAMEKAYAELRETYDDPTDEQILAVAGDNLRGYQRKIGNKAGNWGTAFGSNKLFGSLNKDTRAALESGYQAGLAAQSASNKRDDVVYSLGEGEGQKKVSKGMQMDVRNWGDNVKDTDNITPEQVKNLNKIMQSGGFTGFTIPTQQVTSKNDKGEDVTTDVEQNVSLYDLLESATPDEIAALEYLGFIDDEDGAYIRPHNETFEEKLARREREKERIDLLTKQKALQRQQARLGIADLAAGIGDMIKASGGAIVTPRDYRAMYDSLTEQQKVNYNNYLARMQALKEAEKAKQKEAADRAYQERLLREQREFQMAQDKAQRDWQSGEYDKNRQAELLSASIKAGTTGSEKSVDASFNGKKFTFKNKDTYTSAMHNIFGIIKEAITDSNGNLIPPYSTTFSNLDGKVPQSEIYSVIAASAMDSPEIRRQYGKRINETLEAFTGTSGNPINVDAPTHAAATTTGKRYQNAQGHMISEQEFNNLSFLVKPLYQEVK